MPLSPPLRGCHCTHQISYQQTHLICVGIDSQEVMFSFSSVCVCVCVKVVVSVLCHVTTFCTALDLDTPGRPLPDFIFCPRTSCFRLLTRTSNGLFFGSLLFSLFFFFLATTSADSLFLGFPILLALVFYITPHSTWKFHPHV